MCAPEISDAPQGFCASKCVQSASRAQFVLACKINKLQVKQPILPFVNVKIKAT